MKIDPLSGQRPSAPRRGEKSKAAPSAEFARQLDGAAPGAGPVAGGTGLGPVDALLALQEVPEASAGQDPARQRGEDLLDLLDQLRLDLLAGSLPGGRLEQLAELLAERREQAEDPQLRAVIEEIELRAAVELAKLGR